MSTTGGNNRNGLDQFELNEYDYGLTDRDYADPQAVMSSTESRSVQNHEYDYGLTDHDYADPQAVMGSTELKSVQNHENEPPIFKNAIDTFRYFSWHLPSYDIVDTRAKKATKWLYWLGFEMLPQAVRGLLKLTVELPLNVINDLSSAVFGTTRSAFKRFGVLGKVCVSPFLAVAAIVSGVIRSLIEVIKSVTEPEQSWRRLRAFRLNRYPKFTAMIHAAGAVGIGVTNLAFWAAFCVTVGGGVAAGMKAIGVSMKVLPVIGSVLKFAVASVTKLIGMNLSSAAGAAYAAATTATIFLGRCAKAALSSRTFQKWFETLMASGQTEKKLIHELGSPKRVNKTLSREARLLVRAQGSSTPTPTPTPTLTDTADIEGDSDEEVAVSGSERCLPQTESDRDAVSRVSLRGGFGIFHLKPKNLDHSRSAPVPNLGYDGT